MRLSFSTEKLHAFMQIHQVPKYPVTCMYMCIQQILYMQTLSFLSYILYNYARHYFQALAILKSNRNRMIIHVITGCFDAAHNDQQEG